jgi:hypothetical protein
MEFKIGDKVEIKRILDLSDLPENAEKIFIGAKGIIVKIVPQFQYPYGIKFDDDKIDGLDCIYWETEEIELASKGEVSDGYHTFNELYYHRMILFAVICNTYRGRAWKSWKHHDNTMYDNYFIVGVDTMEGQYTYHYHKDHWDMFDVLELESAPEYDGHKPEDITRLLTLMHFL